MILLVDRVRRSRYRESFIASGSGQLGEVSEVVDKEYRSQLMSREAGLTE